MAFSASVSVCCNDIDPLKSLSSIIYFTWKGYLFDRNWLHRGQYWGLRPRSPGGDNDGPSIRSSQQNNSKPDNSTRERFVRSEIIETMDRTPSKISIHSLVVLSVANKSLKYLTISDTRNYKKMDYSRSMLHNMGIA